MFLQISKKLSEQLNVIVTFNMGSALHNTMTETSDIDTLNLYYDPEYSYNPYEFGLQYKSEQGDNNYQEIRSFIHQVSNGVHPAFFEVLFDTKPCHSNIVYENYLDFHLNTLLATTKTAILDKPQYNLIKSYMGYMKKDLKRFKTTKDLVAKNKYAAHIVRQTQIIGFITNDREVMPIYDEKSTQHIIDIKVGKLNITPEYLEENVNRMNAIKINNHDLINSGKVNRTIDFDMYINISKKLRSLITILESLKLKDINVNGRLELNNLKYNVINNGLDFQYT